MGITWMTIVATATAWGLLTHLSFRKLLTDAPAILILFGIGFAFYWSGRPSTKSTGNDAPVTRFASTALMVTSALWTLLCGICVIASTPSLFSKDVYESGWGGLLVSFGLIAAAGGIGAFIAGRGK
jgi:hypothetical protein